jgi:hypothetical protein
MGETRVNLQHLLEDIRDSYPFPQEEAIVTELIANALDSGAAEVAFLISPRHAVFTIVDNGSGMPPRVLEGYHDIAASTKVRGRGIGFAGVGAKLALLVAEAVATETVHKGAHKATLWRLESPIRAPWEYIPAPRLFDTAHGTAVSMKLRDPASSLLDPAFVEHVIQAHFYPLLDDEFMDKLLRKVYPRGVRFTINGQPVRQPANERPAEVKTFWVQTGRNGKPIGIGFLRKSLAPLADEQRGIAISTFGKVIKRGWEWIGITPRNPELLSGVVEIPGLSQILTLNKADFLRDAGSLRKYYRFRKAVQEAVEPLLKQLDEVGGGAEHSPKNLRPLEKELELVLSKLEGDFPELSPLLGRPRRWNPDRPRPEGAPLPAAAPADPLSAAPDWQPPAVSFLGAAGSLPPTAGALPAASPLSGEPQPSGELQPAGASPPPADPPTGGLRMVVREAPAPNGGHPHLPDIMIGFENNPARDEIAWMVENTIWINRAHPAYQRVADTEAETYHIVLAVSWVLSRHLEDEKSPQLFINRFLSNWGSRA